MIPKTGKDETEISNWRPISLLNVDYKMLAKVLATLVKKIVGSIIGEEQSGFVTNRYIGQNIRLIDLIEFYEHKDEEGFLAFLDIENAFPSIDRYFIMKSLEFFGFGQKFCNYVKCLYKKMKW